MEPGLLGNTIRQARLNCKMTQEELAEAVQITPTHLKHIESEHRKPSVEVLFSLASILHFSIDALLLPDINRTRTQKTHEILSLISSCTVSEMDVLLAALHELAHQQHFHDFCHALNLSHSVQNPVFYLFIHPRHLL